METVTLHTRASVPVEFTAVSGGAFVDPTTVTLKIKTPPGNITTYTHPNAQITKTDVGRYTTSVLFNIPGRWLIEWRGQSSNEVIHDFPITVLGSEFYDNDGVAIPDS